MLSTIRRQTIRQRQRDQGRVTGAFFTWRRRGRGTDRFGRSVGTGVPIGTVRRTKVGTGCAGKRRAEPVEFVQPAGGEGSVGIHSSSFLCSPFPDAYYARFSSSDTGPHSRTERAQFFIPFVKRSVFCALFLGRTFVFRQKEAGFAAQKEDGRWKNFSPKHIELHAIICYYSIIYRYNPKGEE